MVCISSSPCAQGREEAFAMRVAPRPRPGATADAALVNADPLVVLGVDLFLTNVLPRLDATSLAACTAVCSSWRTLCTSDLLWRPLLSTFLSLSAHIPLRLGRSLSPISPYVAYSIARADAAKVEISPEEMCARIWEMKVKPTCGAYWHSLDPTSRGEDPLLRRFQCDQTVRSMQDMDPIWGGQESTWELVSAKASKPGGQCVQINSWPQHRVLRLPDGRWRLDNYYASYTTCADQESNMPSYLQGRMVGYCTRCNPEPGKEEKECARVAQKAEASLVPFSTPRVSF